MKTGSRWAPILALIMGVGLFGDPEPADAVPPGGLPDAAPPFGLPASAPPFGTGKGKGNGKGNAVARVSYHCLGVAKQVSKTQRPYSYVAEMFRADARNRQFAMLDGGATADLVTEGGISSVPTLMAGASMHTSGLSLQSYDTCGVSAGSALNSVVVGEDKNNPGASGSAYVQFIISFHGLRLETHAAEGSEGMFTASTVTSLQALGLEESFTVSASGELLEVPPGLSVIDLSHEGHYVYEISGQQVVSGGTLFYGPGISNIVRTTFQASGGASAGNTNGAKIAVGSASAEAVNTIAIEIKSLDPGVSFSFVPAE